MYVESREMVAGKNKQRMKEKYVRILRWKKFKRKKEMVAAKV